MLLLGPASGRLKYHPAEPLMYDSLFDRLQALVRVDLSRRTATITVRGCFTTTNYRGLLPVIRRAHALPGALSVTVDLCHATRIHPAAIGLLENECQAMFPHTAHIPVRIISSRVPAISQGTTDPVMSVAA